MVIDGAPALRQPVPATVIKRGVSFTPVLENGGTTFSMEKLKELLNEQERLLRIKRKTHSKSKRYHAKPPKNQKRPKNHKQRM